MCYQWSKKMFEIGGGGGGGGGALFWCDAHVHMPVCFLHV